MSREIKFRWWNNQHYLYADLDTLYFLFKVGFSPTINTGKSLQQYTGLKDKNGKEIYEGDILRYPNFGFDPSNGDCPYRIGLIEFKENMYTLSGDYIAEFEMGDIEIIGNIYENPELLNE